MWIKTDRTRLDSILIPIDHPSDRPISMEWGSEWGKAPHSMCPYSERGMGRHSVWPAPAGSLVSPGFPSHSSGHPRVGLLSFLQKPDPTKIPLPYSLPRLPACRRRTHLRCRGVRMAIPSGEKHALSGAPNSGVLIFVGSGFALRAAANLPRCAVRRWVPREASAAESHWPS